MGCNGDEATGINDDSIRAALVCLLRSLCKSTTKHIKDGDSCLCETTLGLEDGEVRGGVPWKGIPTQWPLTQLGRNLTISRLYNRTGSQGMMNLRKQVWIAGIQVCDDVIRIQLSGNPVSCSKCLG